MDNIMISVLIPVYNTKSEYLKECFDSVLNQTWSAFEIVVINNESTNYDTIEVLNDLFVRQLPNVKMATVKRQQGKKNLSIALNAGLQLCEFEYIARLDSDDVMLPDRLEKQIHYMITNPNVDVLGGQAQNMFGDKHITSHPLRIPQDYYKRSTHFLNHPSVMFKKSSILKIGGYKESPDHIPEDFVLWAKALKNGCTIHNLPDIVINYRNREDNLSEIDSRHKEWYDAIYEVMRD
jgi:glycosyltransferase involved in cell wall biosynthesis